jgi:hypothetical protein
VKDLTDMPFTDSDFQSEEERRVILELWKVDDGNGFVWPEWRQSDRLSGNKGPVNADLAALAQ